MTLTLPYPAVSFVPLDVLTAQELNEVVANYEYIADQFPVKADNIDWTTLSSITATMSSNGAATALQRVPFDMTLSSQGTSLQLQDDGGIVVGRGVSKVSVSFSVFFEKTGSVQYGWASLLQNANVVGGAINGLQNNYCSVGLSDIELDVQEGDVLSVRSQEGNANIRGGSTFLTVRQIA